MVATNLIQSFRDFKNDVYFLCNLVVSFIWDALYIFGAIGNFSVQGEKTSLSQMNSTLSDKNLPQNFEFQGRQFYSYHEGKPFPRNHKVAT